MANLSLISFRMLLIEAIWLGCLLLSCPGAGKSPSNHAPAPPKWVVINLHTGGIAASNTSADYPFGQWFPDLFVDLCDIVDRWTNPSEWGCNSVQGKAETRYTPFYVCPGHIHSWFLADQCGGPWDAYCAAWSSVSTGSIPWKPPMSSDYITVLPYNRTDPGIAKCPSPSGRKGAYQPCGACYSSHFYPWRPYATPRGTCNMLKISFTEEGKRQDWTGGKTWGIHLYVDGTDPAATFMIQLLREALPSTPMGPNPSFQTKGQMVCDVLSLF